MDVSQALYDANWARTFIGRPEKQSPAGQPNGFVLQVELEPVYQLVERIDER